MREIPQTISPRESRTSKSASTVERHTSDYTQFVHKYDIFQGKVIVYLIDSRTKQLTLLVIPKIHILLLRKGSVAGEPFLVMSNRTPSTTCSPSLRPSPT
jgi:hypothetical protein